MWPASLFHCLDLRRPWWWWVNFPKTLFCVFLASSDHCGGVFVPLTSPVMVKLCSTFNRIQIITNFKAFLWEQTCSCSRLTHRWFQLIFPLLGNSFLVPLYLLLPLGSCFKEAGILPMELNHALLTVVRTLALFFPKSFISELSLWLEKTYQISKAKQIFLSSWKVEELLAWV